MHSTPDRQWLVACLCAAWCGTCRDYRATFGALALVHTGYRFLWVDIEDEADALAPFELDIDNFPTLLIARGTELRFLGALTPLPMNLVRTLDAARAAVLCTEEREDAPALIACVAAVGEPLG